MIQLKPEPVVLKQATGQLKTTSISINQAIEEQRKRQFIPTDDMPQKPFDINDVIQSGR